MRYYAVSIFCRGLGHDFVDGAAKEDVGQLSVVSGSEGIPVGTDEHHDGMMRKTAYPTNYGIGGLCCI